LANELNSPEAKEVYVQAGLEALTVGVGKVLSVAADGLLSLGRKAFGTGGTQVVEDGAQQAIRNGDDLPAGGGELPVPTAGLLGGPANAGLPRPVQRVPVEADEAIAATRDRLAQQADELRADTIANDSPTTAARRYNGRRNYAAAEYEIDGQTGSITSASGNHTAPGTVGRPEDPRYNATDLGDEVDRSLDTEKYILEDLAKRITPDASGTVHIYSRKPVCESCSGVIDQFIKEHPNVVVITYDSQGRIVRYSAK
jgi:hypothetical protein